MAAMGLLHWRNTVCRSAGNVIRKPVAISVRRSGAYFLVSTGADAGRQKELATASKPCVMPPADRIDVPARSSTDRSVSRYKLNVRGRQLYRRASGDLCRRPVDPAAMFLHLCAPSIIEMAVWQSADRITAILFWLLRQLPSGWLGLDARWLGISIVPWLALIVWRFHAWRTAPAFCLTCLVLLSRPFWRSASVDEWRATMLDVGQGLAVVIERQGAAFLYDTGLAA